MTRTEDGLRDFYTSLRADPASADRLQDWLDAGPVAHRRPLLPALAAVVVVAVVAVVAGVLSSRTATTKPAAPAVATTFVTTEGRAIQLRSLQTGAVEATVPLRSADVSVARMADGQLLVATTTGCSSSLDRIEPATGASTHLRTFSKPLSDIAVSPDGTRLAYTTRLHCFSCPSICAGPASYLPNVLAIMDLSSGSTRRTETGNEGLPFLGISWSPDGRHIVGATTTDNGEDELRIYDAAQPDFANASRLPRPGGCSYFSPTWTQSGIVAAQACSGEGHSPSRLLRLTPVGVINHAWALPACINGLITRSDPTHTQLLVQADVGYGNDACAKNPVTLISAVDGGQPRTILSLPGVNRAVDLTG